MDLHVQILFAYFEGPAHKSHPLNRMRSSGANSPSGSLKSVPCPSPHPSGPAFRSQAPDPRLRAVQRGDR